jgi:hypothetical protein
MFTKNIKDYFTDDLLNTVRGVLGEAKKCSEDCTCEKCESEKDEMTEGKRGLWDNIHAKRKRIKAGSGERMRKPGSEGAPSNADLKAASEGVMPTADEPSDKDKKTAQKIRDMMAKEKKPVKEEAEELDEISKATMGRYINKAKDSIDTASYRQGHKEAHGSSSKTLEKKLSKRHKGISTAVNKLTKEESEQIDELSKATMGRYINKAATKMGSQGVTAGLKIAADEKSSKNFKDMGKREKGIKLAVSKLTKEEQEFIDALNNEMFEEIELEEGQKPYVSHSRGGVGRSAEANVLNSKGETSKTFTKKEHGPDYMKKANAHLKKNYNKLMGEESLEMTEGRGRPPKEGSAAWKARQGKADDDMVALGMQLRKAQSINKKVRFMDGKEHDIHQNHITRFNDHMGARRTTQEKDNFQRQAHKSHADFVKAVSAPVPKASKDTGEIVKYR